MCELTSKDFAPVVTGVVAVVTGLVTVCGVSAIGILVLLLSSILEVRPVKLEPWHAYCNHSFTFRKLNYMFSLLITELKLNWLQHHISQVKSCKIFNTALKFCTNLINAIFAYFENR